MLKHYMSGTMMLYFFSFSKGLQVITMQRSGGELKREKILLKQVIAEEQEKVERDNLPLHCLDSLFSQL